MSTEREHIGIASDYKLSEGGLLPFGLLILAAAPLIAAKARGAIYKR